MSLHLQLGLTVASPLNATAAETLRQRVAGVAGAQQGNVYWYPSETGQVRD
jgi:hypothetical protein